MTAKAMVSAPVSAAIRRGLPAMNPPIMPKLAPVLNPRERLKPGKTGTASQCTCLRISVAIRSMVCFSMPKKLCGANGPQLPLIGALPPSIQTI